MTTFVVRLIAVKVVDNGSARRGIHDARGKKGQHRRTIASSAESTAAASPKPSFLAEVCVTGKAVQLRYDSSAATVPFDLHGRCRTPGRAAAVAAHRQPTFNLANYARRVTPATLDVKRFRCLAVIRQEEACTKRYHH